MRDYLKGKRCMVWSFMGNSRMYQALRDYGDRLDTVGIFTFEVDASGAISETGTSISTMLTYINKWPHIKWLLTIMNHGTASIFTALRDNTGGAKDMFLSEIVRIMGKYPWCAGIDIDLERGGGYENRTAANTLFRDIYRTVKAYDPAKLVNICLPGMTGVQGSVGGENWCVYADLDAYCDTASIMSYGMAWAGSAPGPVSPRSWLEGIYNYAVQAMNPEKLFMGLPGYGWNWQIYDTPENLGKTYRGTSNTYYAAKLWMTGGYNFTDDKPPQPFIPIVAYWDDYDKVPWALPQVYDYMEGQDAVSYEYPLLSGTYNRRHYLTAYGKEQKASFGTVFLDRGGGTPDSYSGVVSVSDFMTVLGEDSSAVFRFSIASAGTYDIAVRLCFPFWDKNALRVTVDGSAKTFSENRLWWPYWRRTCWLSFGRMSLSAGTHTLTIDGGVPGVQFYGFRVCSAFSEAPSAGEASFMLSPRQFLDVNGNPATPDKGFKLTCEMLRRKPDSALVWYEDFRDENPLPESFWTTLSGKWSVWREGYENRPYSLLEGSGKLAWKYEGFSDLHIRARIGFAPSGGGRAGVFLGNLFCCLNFDTQRVELYQGSVLLGSYAVSFSKTPASTLHSDPTLYTIEMRKRGNRVRVYFGFSYTLRFTATVSATGGYAGIQADSAVVCDLLRAGDAWAYEPYECFTVEYPDGQRTSFGRIARIGVSWDEEFQVFSVNSDVEETATRSEDISLDYDFFHSHTMALACGGDYPVKIIPQDINLWTARLFLGDADGFSILYYQDVDSLVYWANEAAYRWKLRGIAIWSLGQEDMRLWEALPKQIT
ncbi:MAG: glycosyl hydrolase family 18 protein [[Clostridium] innocuum]